MVDLNENSQIKGTPMDDYLKPLVVEKLKDALDFAIKGMDIECFMAYKGLFHLIESYDFQLKTELTKLTNLLYEHIKSLQGRPLDSASLVQMRSNKVAFRDLLQIYMSHIPAAYAELGLWFKVIPHKDNYDKQLSMENFSDEFTSLSDRKKEILKLTTKEIVKMMKPNAINDVYAKLLIENAV